MTSQIRREKVKRVPPPSAAKSREEQKRAKRTLLHLLSGVGRLAGIDLLPTPGEECALRIACKVLERAALEEINLCAEYVADDHPELKCFWVDGQWVH